MTTWQEEFVQLLRHEGLNPPSPTELPTMDAIRRAADEFRNWNRTLDGFNQFVFQQLEHVPNTLVASGLCPSWTGLLTMIPQGTAVFEGYRKFHEAIQRLRQAHGNAGVEHFDILTELDSIMAMH